MTERNSETPIEVGEHVWGQASCWWYDEAGVAATSNEVDMLDKIELLQAEARRVRLDHITTLGELQVADDAIDALRAAGDALVSLLSHSHVEPCKPPKGWTLESWCSECYYIGLWQEVRRER